MEDALSVPTSPGTTAWGRAAPLPSFPIELVTPTHYARLGLDETADAAAIEAAWRRLQPSVARAVVGSGAAQGPAWPCSGVPETPAIRARQREVAYRVLSDPARRAVYDAWLAECRLGITSPPSAAPRWLARVQDAFRSMRRRAQSAPAG